ncbi:MAG: protein kinase [Planctomycetota bacterium]
MTRPHNDSHDADAAQFEQLLELDEAGRRRRLEALRTENPDQALRLERLLTADAAADERALDRTPGELVDGPNRPQTIGRFRILGELGRGGMGVVYEAEQERPKRRVAVKVLRSGALDRAIRRRFEFEGELLARLEHPGLARVYEVGEAGGLPFIAMERVEGQPIDQWVATRGPDQRAVVELLARVAEAVAHAHERGVVHRDLKPANVLVDAAGQPKVLDFGIARALDLDAGEDSLRTRAGELWGTLVSMAPEQATGRSDAIGTPTDVYALGVLAFRLLCGHFPHDVRGLPLQEGLRKVAEDPIPRPSQIEPRTRGDLETILLHALEKEPERRYSSAAEFARDLRRALANEPIFARPPSAVYQLSRFARRHRAVVVAASLVAASLLVGTVVSSLLYLESESRGRRLDAALTAARQAQASTEQRTEELLAAEDFFDAILAEASPLQDGAEVRVVEALERTVERLDESEVSREARTRLLRRLGATLFELDRRDSARAALVEALAAMGPEDPEQLATRARLARLVWSIDQDEAALVGLEEVLEHAREAPWSATPEGLELRRDWIAALTATSQIERADAELETARAVADELEPRERALLELTAAGVDLAAGRMESAVAHSRAGLADLGGLAGAESFEVLEARQLLATAQYYLGDYDSALETATESLARVEGLVESPHASLLGPLEVICLVQIERLNLEAAGVAIDRALAIARQLYAADSLVVANLLVQRAGVHEFSGAVDEALVDYGTALESLRQADPNLTLVSALAQFGALHLREGNLDRALGPLAESAALHATLTTPDDLRRGWTLRALGQAQDRSGRTRDALATHRAAYEIALANEELTGPGAVIEYGVSVAEMLLDLDRPQEALEQLEFLSERVRTFDNEYLAQVHGLQLGAALCRLDDQERGAELIRAAAGFFTADGEYTPRAAKRMAALGER